MEHPNFRKNTVGFNKQIPLANASFQEALCIFSCKSAYLLLCASDTQNIKPAS